MPLLCSSASSRCSRLPNVISKESIAKVIAACLSLSFADCSLLRSSAKACVTSSNSCDIATALRRRPHVILCQSDGAGQSLLKWRHLAVMLGDVKGRHHGTHVHSGGKATRPRVVGSARGGRRNNRRGAKTGRYGGVAAHAAERMGGGRLADLTRVRADDRTNRGGRHRSQSPSWVT
jgi:hypothetical protein